MHEHIQALLMFEINKKLEELQRRGVGYIDCEYMGGINYKIDDMDKNHFCSYGKRKPQKEG